MPSPSSPSAEDSFNASQQSLAGVSSHASMANSAAASGTTFRSDTTSKDDNTNSSISSKHHDDDPLNAAVHAKDSDSLSACTCSRTRQTKGGTTTKLPSIEAMPTSKSAGGQQVQPATPAESCQRRDSSMIKCAKCEALSNNTSGSGATTKMEAYGQQKRSSSDNKDGSRLASVVSDIVSQRSGTDMDQWTEDIAPLPSPRPPPPPSAPGAFAIVSGRVSNSNNNLDTSTDLPSSSNAVDEPEGQAEDSPPSSEPVTLNAVLSPDEDTDNACCRGTTGTHPCDATLTSNAAGTFVSYEFSEHDLEANHPDISEDFVVLDGKIVEEEEEEARPTWMVIGIVVVIVVLLTTILLMALGLAGVFVDEDGDTMTPEDHILESTNHPDMAPSSEPPPVSRFDIIRDRGYVNCFFFHVPGFLYKDSETGEVSGFNSVWCKAVAAALFGPEDVDTKMKYIHYNPAREGEVDLSPLGSTPTMNRFFPNSDISPNGLYFTTPFFYDGLRVAGDPFYVRCFEDDFHHVQECADLMLCVHGQTTHETFAFDSLPSRRIFVVDKMHDVPVHFASGDCNIMLIKQETASEPTLREMGYQGNYTIGQKLFNSEPWSVVTHQTDPLWCDFVDSVVQSLMAAESHGISQSTAHLMPETHVFGADLKKAFQNAVSAVGNYGEVYQQFLQADIPRRAINMLNDGTTGQMRSFPFGNINPIEQVYASGPMMQKVLKRGRLRCGVQLGRPGFAIKMGDGSMQGMDIDFCKAAAAGLFGDVDSLEIVAVDNPRDGFNKLASGEADIIAGAQWNLEHDVMEPSTGLGFSFSQPYFYGSDDDNMCLATLQDDHAWSAYVFWLVSATIYAEEKGITEENCNDMPYVYVFGSGLRRVFRDAILAVGNFGQVYNRNLGSIFPRSGRNLLNDNPLGPQFYPVPGLT